jgi:hypothetical protein
MLFFVGGWLIHVTHFQTYIKNVFPRPPYEICLAYEQHIDKVYLFGRKIAWHWFGRAEKKTEKFWKQPFIGFSKLPLRKYSECLLLSLLSIDRISMKKLWTNIWTTLE